jgi:hypothetical protein
MKGKRGRMLNRKGEEEELLATDPHRREDRHRAICRGELPRGKGVHAQGRNYLETGNLIADH